MKTPKSYKVTSYKVTFLPCLCPWQKLTRSVSNACIRTEQKGLPDGAEGPRTPCARGVRNFLQKMGKNRGAKKSDFGHFICIYHKILVPLQCIWRCIASEGCGSAKAKRVCPLHSLLHFTCQCQSERQSAQSGSATKQTKNLTLKQKQKQTKLLTN